MILLRPADRRKVVVWRYEAGYAECIDTPPTIVDTDGDGKPDVAVHICQDTVQLNPYSPAALLRLARTYSVLGDHRKAVSTLERLLGFDPGNEAARRALDIERNTR